MLKTFAGTGINDDKGILLINLLQTVANVVTITTNETMATNANPTVTLAATTGVKTITGSTVGTLSLSTTDQISSEVKLLGTDTKFAVNQAAAKITVPFSETLKTASLIDQLYANDLVVTRVSDNKVLVAGTDYTTAAVNGLSAYAGTNNVIEISLLTAAGTDSVYTVAVKSDARYIQDSNGNFAVANGAVVTASNIDKLASAAPTLAAQTVIGGANVTIPVVATGDTAWLAPAGTTVFTAGATKTSVAGDGVVTTIAAPATAGAYKLYLVDTAGNASAESTGVATVDNTAPTASAAGTTDATNNGTALVLTYSEALYNGGVAIADGADVKALFTYNGTAANYTSATYNATAKTVTFAFTAAENAKTLTVASTVTDQAGNAVSSTTDVATYATTGTVWTLN